MSVAIQKVTIGSLVDGRAVISNGGIARKLSVGTNWTELRIALLFHWSDSGANMASGPDLMVGIMTTPESGLTNSPLFSTCQHYFGTYHGGTGSPTWTRTAGPPAYYSGQIYAGRMVGSTWYYEGYLNNTKMSATNTIRKPIIVRLRKSAGTMDVRLCGPVAWNATNVTEDMIRGALTLPTFTYGDYSIATDAASWSTSGVSQTAPAYDEATYGPLNTLFVGWNREEANLNACAVYYASFP